MNYTVKINKVTAVDELEGAWSAQDYITLLEEFGFSDATGTNLKELRELLFMAISDYDTDEAASILLNYKLSDTLSEGQIQQLSHEMLEDKICEEYPDISLHHQLFHINQLLYKAYNGKFPHAKATIIEFSVDPNTAISEEVILKLFYPALSERCVLKRLFAEQLEGKLAFPEASSIAWQLISKGGNAYSLITSEYWIEKDDFQVMEFSADVIEFIEEEED